MNAETWVSIGVTGVTAVTGLFAGQAARRTRRQESRDDFTAVTKEMRTSLDSVKKELANQKAESDAQKERLAETDEAVAWLVTRVRDLVAAIRKTGGEPPAPRPMSPRAAHILERSDV